MFRWGNSTTLLSNKLPGWHLGAAPQRPPRHRTLTCEPFHSCGYRHGYLHNPFYWKWTNERPFFQCKWPDEHLNVYHLCIFPQKCCTCRDSVNNPWELIHYYSIQTSIETYLGSWNVWIVALYFCETMHAVSKRIVIETVVSMCCIGKGFQVCELFRGYSG